MDTIKQKISDYLKSHKFLNLATVSSDGKPDAHTLGYVFETDCVYFITDRNTRKMQNISSNPFVAFTVDDDKYEKVTAIKAIQIRGKAQIVADESKGGQLKVLFLDKFPQYAVIPPNPDHVFVRVSFTEGYFLDNTVALGHRDRIEY